MTITDDTTSGPGAGKSRHARPITTIDVGISDGPPVEVDDHRYPMRPAIRITQEQLRTAGCPGERCDSDLFPVNEEILHEHGPEGAIDEMLYGMGHRIRSLLAKVDVLVDHDSVMGAEAYSFVAGEAITRFAMQGHTLTGAFSDDERTEAEYAHALMRLAMIHLGGDEPLMAMPDEDAERNLAPLLA